MIDQRLIVAGDEISCAVRPVAASSREGLTRITKIPVFNDAVIMFQNFTDQLDGCLSIS